MNRSAAEAFQLLGIPPDSDRTAIAHAYRELARTVHPDVSADADAAERFANLAEAYRIATTAPELPPVVRTGGPILVRRPRPGSRPTPRAPIVAGPVRIRPSSEGTERQLHE